MYSNYLTLNLSQTEFLLIGLPQQTSKIVYPSLSLPTTKPIMPSLSAKNLGFIFDSTLSFSKQISSLSSACHYHIRDLPPVSTRLKFADRSFRNSSPRLGNSTNKSKILSTPSHPCRTLSLSRNQFLSCLKNPPLHSFLPSIISLLSRFFLLLSRPASFTQYSSRTNANKHLRIHHHLRVLVSRGLYKALLYFTIVLLSLL